MTIWTIGHSTLSEAAFLGLLNRHEIKLLADVRLFPGSRRFPHFSQESLARSLQRSGIEYQHFSELGGRRKPQPDSHNTAWRHEAFRGYADYMETEHFKHGIERLLTAASEKRTAIMCAEALWWRCHRGLISDFLKVRGIEVLHIASTGKTDLHPYTSAARIVEGKLTYGADQPELSLPKVKAKS
jgi:uncharacterized protein (DUF488 family)